MYSLGEALSFLKTTPANRSPEWNWVDKAEVESLFSLDGTRLLALISGFVAPWIP